MQIKINHKIFNKIYWPLIDALHNEDLRFITIYGGSSSSKTYSIIQAIIFELMLKEGSKTLILRKYATDIKDSVYSDFKEQIERYKLHSLFQKKINLIESATGGAARFRGLDDSEKLKGLASYKRVYLNEITQFDKADLKQVRKRLRGHAGQQIISDFNPIDENHWFKTDVLDVEQWYDLDHNLDEVNSFMRINEAGDHLLIKTTYLDNYWIVGNDEDDDHGFKDVHTIADFERDKKHDFNYYNIYALGNWGRIETGGEFYKSFDVFTHAKPQQYNPDEILHVSFDENVSPYMACTIWQYYDGTLRQIDEICLKNPRNTLDHTCSEFIKRYQGHTAGVYIYGDATSRKQDVKQQKGVNFYTLIKQRLREFDPVDRVPLSNPPVMPRGMFINALFAGKINGVNVEINESCKESIMDFKYVVEASDGGKLKKKIKDKTTGATYEQHGHTSDTADYLIIKLLNNEYRAFRNNTKTQKKEQAFKSMRRSANKTKF